MPSFKAILLLVGTAASIAVPTTLVTHPTLPAIQDFPLSSSISCDNRYCDGSTSWCFYWAGITTYDPTLGPLPGETRRSLGRCGKTTTETTYASYPTPGVDVEDH
ncbi:hypothetical protein CC79DRAFT_1362391 [Sarocladium strictum]